LPADGGENALIARRFLDRGGYTVERLRYD